MSEKIIELARFKEDCIWKEAQEFSFLLPKDLVRAESCLEILIFHFVRVCFVVQKVQVKKLCDLNNSKEKRRFERPGLTHMQR